MPLTNSSYRISAAISSVQRLYYFQEKNPLGYVKGDQLLFVDC